MLWPQQDLRRLHLPLLLLRHLGGRLRPQRLLESFGWGSTANLNPVTGFRMFKLFFLSLNESLHEEIVISSSSFFKLSLNWMVWNLILMRSFLKGRVKSPKHHHTRLFCGVCLQWFSALLVDKAGSDPRTPKQDTKVTWKPLGLEQSDETHFFAKLTLL